MSLLLSIQNVFRVATPWLVGVATVFALLALGARLVERKPCREALAQFKRLGLLWQVFIVLSVGSATRWAGAKGDRGAPTPPLQLSGPGRTTLSPPSTLTPPLFMGQLEGMSVQVMQINEKMMKTKFQDWSMTT